ncbi:MAG TPA: ABC transporter permease [Kouleothrix sp.]|jgi:tungstate transport system permease protein|uniref:ABC transporter permease n=1 Tax=Kouleothrix sp. TaxID=2779161 RepID=UPI002BDE3BBC|nr:ABC transporter permease [Kouleothrix sp.]
MDDLLQGAAQALRLLLGGDRETWQIVALSLYVSGAALLISTLLGVPLGAWLGLRRFRGQRLAVALLYTGMGFPPVVIGLFVYLLLSRAGPLGMLGWLFTPRAMIAAQSILGLPLVGGFTLAAVGGVDPALRTQVRALGASAAQATLAVLWEARAGVIAGVAAGFGGIISEVGAVMLVGGNIQGDTRVLTTAIVLETRKGSFDTALALAFVLLGLTFALNALALRLQRRIE